MSVMLDVARRRSAGRCCPQPRSHGDPGRAVCPRSQPEPWSRDPSSSPGTCLSPKRIPAVFLRFLLLVLVPGVFLRQKLLSRLCQSG